MFELSLEDGAWVMESEVLSCVPVGGCRRGGEWTAGLQCGHAGGMKFEAAWTWVAGAPPTAG